ncbi:hypothetical protein CRM22_000400 [Opisthorchis felineus]|nr:hypothetical protein CRM22_000400 [Opisthorchis felineus]
MDYTETVFYVFKYGPPCLRKPKGKIKHTVNVFLIVTQIGFSCVYTLFITDNLRYFLHAFFPDLYLNFYVIALIVCVCLIPMSLWSSMRVLAYLSAVANLATLIGAVLIFVYLLSSGLLPFTTLPVYTNPRGVLIGFSIVMFAFEGISLVVQPGATTVYCGYLLHLSLAILHSCINFRPPDGEVALSSRGIRKKAVYQLESDARTFGDVCICHGDHHTEAGFNDLTDWCFCKFNTGFHFATSSGNRTSVGRSSPYQMVLAHGSCKAHVFHFHWSA